MSRLAETLMPQAFGGSTFDPQKDGARLSKQLKSVLALMSDGKWRTLAEIAQAVGCSEASASARLRDFRKTAFGGFKVDRWRVNGGLYRYRLRVQG